MQKRYREFQVPISSFERNSALSGVIPGSVYRGFDAIDTPVGLTLNINHTASGEVEPDVTQVNSSPMGVWVTNQGTTIKETASIPITILTNAANGFYRNDYLIGRHHHDVISVGGIGAIYEIIEGPTGSDTLKDPATISGNDFTILGIIRIPPNASDTSAVTWKRSRVPSLGNKFPALLDEANSFTDQQQQFQAILHLNILSATFDGILTRGYLAGLDKGNQFIIDGGAINLDLLPVKQPGTEIQILFSVDTTLRPFISQLTGGHAKAGYTAGYRPIVINYNTSDNLLIKAHQIATFRMVDQGGVYASDNVVFGDYWKLIGVSDTPAMINIFSQNFTSINTQISTLNDTITTLTNLINGLDGPGTIRSVKIFGNLADYFRLSDGRGRPDSIYPKHQICNGLLGTPNMNDAKLTGFSSILSSYPSDGDPDNLLLTGENNITLEEGNIPQLRIPFHGVLLNKPADGGTPSSKYVKPLATEGPMVDGQTPIDPVGNPTPDAIDVRGKNYQVIFIMRLTDETITDNPF